jgi:two-component system NtrC family sensor kinase
MLRMMTAYSIVNQHGGHIETASELGKGSTFTVWLPVHRVAAVIAEN